MHSAGSLSTHPRSLHVIYAMKRTADRRTLHFLDDFPTSTPSDARSRPPSLILFSLDHDASSTRLDNVSLHGRLRDWAHLRLGSLAVRSISNASVIFLHSYSRCCAWSGVEHDKCSRLLRSSIHARPFRTTRLCGLLLLLHLAPPIPIHHESDWTDHHGSMDLRSDPRPVTRRGLTNR
jgi:hypothetical protein